jgi:hypothetical protein
MNEQRDAKAVLKAVLELSDLELGAVTGGAAKSRMNGGYPGMGGFGTGGFGMGGGFGGYPHHHGHHHHHHHGHHHGY